MILDRLGIRRKQPEPETSPAVPTRRKMMSAREVMGLSLAPHWTDYRSREMLVQGYERNLWVYRCITARQNAICEPEFRVEQYRGRDRGWEAVSADSRADRLRALLNDSTREGTVSKTDLLKMIVGQMDTQGAYYARIVFGGGRPVALHTLPVGSVVPRFDRDQVTQVGWTIRDCKGRAEHVDLDEVLCIRHVHPDAPHKVMPPLLAAGRAVDMDNEAGDWQKTSMQNRGVPDGIFEIDPEASDAEQEQAARSIKEQYAHRDKAREPWVVAGAKFHQMSLTPVEMDYVNSRAMTRTEICAAFGVPEPIAGHLQESALGSSTIEGARRIFWKETMLPLIRDIESQLTRQLAGYFDNGTRGGQSVRVRFDVTNVGALQESMSDKLEQAQRLFELGVPLAKINQRLELGLDTEDIPGAETGYMRSGYIPVTPPGDDEQQLIREIAGDVAEGRITPDAAAVLLARRIDWLSEEEARAIVSEDGGE